MNEAVEHPNHYGGDVPTEPLKVIRVWGCNFAVGNAIKYLSRAGKKDPTKHMEDVEKALFYVKDEIKALQHEGVERVPMAPISAADLETLVEFMPIRSDKTDAWRVLQHLHDEIELARAEKL